MNEASAHLECRNDPQSKVTSKGQDILIYLEDENLEVMEINVLHKKRILRSWTVSVPRSRPTASSLVFYKDESETILGS